MAERYDLPIPVGVSPDQDFVQILDPATGTGTFLVEVIDLIHKTMKEKWEAAGESAHRIDVLWNEYVPKHLLPRLHGYELLMAPYAIAHLKIGLKLYETGYRFGSDERARVYLTNALEGIPELSKSLLESLLPALAHEARAVNEVKDRGRFTVVLGNPPYSGHSANQGRWARNLLHGHDGRETPVENYFTIAGGSLDERNPKWLNDDYVKFIRLAHWQIERTGRGLVGFITNHAYLDNPTFRGMRESLAATFRLQYLLDLHGNAKKKERSPDGGRDRNVFDIQQGVAVGLFVRPPGKRGTHRVYHADRWGDRETPDRGGKYDWLEDNDVSSTAWATLAPKPPALLFVPRDEALQEEYEAGWQLTDIFPVNSVGIVTARDKLAIQWTAEDMERVVEDFGARDSEDAREVYELGKDARDWKVELAQEDVLKGDGRIIPVQYRPFDRRFTYYTGRSRGFLCMPRPKVMRHMLAGENLGLCVGRAGQVTGSDNWDVVFVSKHPTDLNLFRRGGNCLFPLYINSTEGGTNPNLGPEFIQAFRTAIGLDFIPTGPGIIAPPSGHEDIFHYLYAVLHSPEYRHRYADFLKSDFPRVPLPANRRLFLRLSRLGASLVRLHLMEAESHVTRPDFSVAGSNRVDKVRYDEEADRVWINGDQYFDGVSPALYAFPIGGYRPAEKWLKERKGRVLTADDIRHYQKMIAVLSETESLMTDIDEIMESHGGW